MSNLIRRRDVFCKKQKIFKRVVAMLLVICLAAGIVFQGPMMVYADVGQSDEMGAIGYAGDSLTELPNKDLGLAASENLTQKWKWSNDFNTIGWGTNSWRFDLAGRKAGQGETNIANNTSITYFPSKNQDGTYNNDGTKGLGFPTYLFLAADPETEEKPNIASYIGNSTSNNNAVIKKLYKTSELLNMGGNNYYSAKHGQHDAEGNEINDNFAYYNGYTETLKFGTGNETINVEFRITTTPSADGQYMLVDYYLAHVGGNIPDEGLNAWLASPFDLGFEGDFEHKDMYMTPRGFYMRRSETSMAVDVITDDDSIGVTPTTTRWTGDYTNRIKEMLDSSETEVMFNKDNSIGYSWKFKLRPYETIHKRVAFAYKEAVYYVSSKYGGDDESHFTARNDGTGGEDAIEKIVMGSVSYPYRNLQDAIDRAKGQNAYIFIQDYEPMDETINFDEMVNDSDTHIVISTADLDVDGNVISEPVVLSRAEGFEGELFVNNHDFALTFSNITIDGNHQEVPEAGALIVANAGSLELNSDLVLQNNGGSAVEVNGNTDFSLNGGYEQIQIKNNRPETGKGALHFNSIGNFSAIYESQIIDNRDKDGQLANVYLRTGSRITVKGDLYQSRIGVTPQQTPKPSSGNIISAEQEVVIAVPDISAGDYITANYFEGNFSSDKDNGNGAGVYTAIGSEDFGNDFSLVLRRSGYSISFVYREAGSGGIVVGAPDTNELFYTVGDDVEINPPTDVIFGYEYVGTTIEQGTGTSLNVNEMTGEVTGTMPERDVVVIYEYNREGSSITFITNGGTPQPPILTGNAGAPMNALKPSVNKRGYLFIGWSEENDMNTANIIENLPAEYPETPLTYYAIFQPDPSVSFDFTEVHVSQSGWIEFFTNKTEGAYSVDNMMSASKKNIPGYVWSSSSSMTSPSTYNYYDNHGAVQIGQFSSAGVFSGRMPGENVVVKFGYGVDYNGPGFDLTVKHVNEWGVEIADSTNIPYFPEDPLSIEPVDTYGYVVLEGEITEGDSEGDFIYPISGRFDNNWYFTGIMPNQSVVITYTYQSNGDKYSFTTNYLDDGLRNIRSPYIQKKTVEAPIEVDFQELYGYNISSAEELGGYNAGSFDGNYNYTGVMPMDDLAVNYHYYRDSSKWKNIIYKSDVNGSIITDNTSSPDIELLSNGTYQASILINDNTAAGNEYSYTWSDIENKALAPKPVADDYYLFAGWYIDKNGNGQFDEGEQVTRNNRFMGGETVIARFEKDPFWWIDIHFATGQYGNFVNPNAETTLSVLKTSTWSGIRNEIPAVEPNPNYIFDGWYKNDVLVTETETLINNQIYTARFDKDPNVFGTEVQTPDGEGHVDTDGSGKITLYGTGEGYQYFVADLDGKILAIEEGNDVVNRLTMTGLSPGSRYQVYEAYDYVQAVAGNNANNLNGVSDPGEILVPVIESNYYVTYDDNNDTLVKLVINPADPETDYALLDMNDNIVSISASNGWKTPTNTNPAQVSFGGLNFDQEYRVVGRPKNKTGVLPTDKINEGTVILTDFGGELEIPYYIIEAIGGTVIRVGEQEPQVQRYELAEEGDLVQLSAEETDGNGGTFQYWKIIIGQVAEVPGKVYNRDIEFEMPDTNIIAYAHYEVSDSNANVEEEVRGGKENEIALEPEDIPGLRDELTTAEDRVLIDTNGANVTYKVVFTKNKASKKEQDAITDSSDYQIHRDHIRAFKAAWGLDITIERYVNGRKTEMASPSNAQFQVITQLDNNDIDMMDYQLYEVETDTNGDITASLVVFEDGNPEENGGLFRFNGEAGKRYILVYSRAHRVTFLNDTKSRSFDHNFPDIFYLNFKVRRYGNVSESYYSQDYYEDDTRPDFFTDNDGVYYWYKGWSTKNMPSAYKAFSLDDEIIQKTMVYAYYLNNWEDVRKKRLELENAIKDALKLSKEPFLTLAERDEIIRDITEAQEVFDQVNRKADIIELQEAIDKLKWSFDRTQEIVDDRNNKYEDQHNNGNSSHGGGGTGSGGGSGSGTIKSPYISKPANSYTVGTNGTWELKDAENNQWYFVLNGGIPLRSMWAYLEYTDSDVSKTGWYYFDQEAVMRSGWIVDEYGSWFYCNPVHDGWYGKMKSGWHQDEVDGFTYYLDGESGTVAIGWREIEGKWYYFNTYNTKNTYYYNSVTKRWEYVKTGEKSLGALYKSERTPDGYLVDENGAWIE